MNKHKLDYKCEFDIDREMVESSEKMEREFIAQQQRERKKHQSLDKIENMC